jgi:hypothetical protein
MCLNILWLFMVDLHPPRAMEMEFIHLFTPYFDDFMDIFDIAYLKFAILRSCTPEFAVALKNQLLPHYSSLIRQERLLVALCCARNPYFSARDIQYFYNDNAVITAIDLTPADGEEPSKLGGFNFIHCLCVAWGWLFLLDLLPVDFSNSVHHHDCRRMLCEIIEADPGRSRQSSTCWPP